MFSNHAEVEFESSVGQSMLAFKTIAQIIEKFYMNLVLAAELK